MDTPQCAFFDGLHQASVAAQVTSYFCAIAIRRALAARRPVSLCVSSHCGGPDHAGGAKACILPPRARASPRRAGAGGHRRPLRDPPEFGLRHGLGAEARNGAGTFQRESLIMARPRLVVAGRHPRLSGNPLFAHGHAADACQRYGHDGALNTKAPPSGGASVVFRARRRIRAVRGWGGRA